MSPDMLTRNAFKKRLVLDRKTHYYIYETLPNGKHEIVHIPKICRKAHRQCWKGCLHFKAKNLPLNCMQKAKLIKGEMENGREDGDTVD